MQFEVQQTLIPPPVAPPTSLWEDVKALPLMVGFIVVAVPIALVVVPIAVLIVLLVAAWEKVQQQLIWPIRKWLGYPLPVVPVVAEEPTVLLRHAQLELVGIQQEQEDMEPAFRELFHKWEETTLHEQYYPGLYRLHTRPEIPGLHGQLVGDLCREWPEGVFLQLVEAQPSQLPASTTWLVYLEFATLRWERVAEAHNYYLLADDSEPEPGLFRGVDSLGATIELRVQAEPVGR